MAQRKSEGSAPDQRPSARENNDKLPLLSILGQGRSSKESSGGFVGALIVSSIALVVALMAFTITFGRSAADNPAIAATVQRQVSTPSASYRSPTPTGPRWTPEPIITGVPQKEASSPSEPPDPDSSDADDDHDGDRPRPGGGRDDNIDPQDDSEQDN